MAYTQNHTIFNALKCNIYAINISLNIFTERYFILDQTILSPCE